MSKDKFAGDIAAFGLASSEPLAYNDENDDLINKHSEARNDGHPEVRRNRAPVFNANRYRVKKNHRKAVTRHFG